MAKNPAKILIVDDEYSDSDSLTNWFRKDGYNVESAENANVALKALQNSSFDIALLDIKMPGMDGMELLERIKAIDTKIVVIMITAFASVETAVKALKEGAFDYVTKPIDPDELSHLVRRALERIELKEENTRLRQTLDDLVGVEEIIGESPKMRNVLELVRHVAQTDATVLIRGESGTGKELVARAIHSNSSRRYMPIVPVNCGALPENLLESEIFGHEKGAFTGAQYRRKGKLEMSDGGTLFLDEIGTIGVKTQVEFLRVLETKEFTRVGGSKSVNVDFRVVCATNEDLEEKVEEGSFRQDLYYRINVFSIEVPPLRERGGDIDLLAQHFVNKFAMQMDKRITTITPEALAILRAHDWPGNVRELANAIERAMVVGQAPAIRPEDLPFIQSSKAAVVSDEPAAVSLADIEKLHVQRILDRNDWNISRSAAALEIDRATLYNKIKKYGLARSGE